MLAQQKPEMLEVLKNFVGNPVMENGQEPQSPTSKGLFVWKFWYFFLQFSVLMWIWLDNGLNLVFLQQVLFGIILTVYKINKKEWINSYRQFIPIEFKKLF